MLFNYYVLLKNSLSIQSVIKNGKRSKVDFNNYFLFQLVMINLATKIV